MKTMFTNKQLLYLFLCNFSILFIGFGLFPLLPLYAAEFGASPSFIGIYLAITYITISLGSFLPSQLSRRLPRRWLFAGAALLGTFALLLLGQAQSLWQVVLLTALLWFSGGIGLSISSVLTGLNTGAAQRGRAFGTLALASPLGALTGGLIVGRLVEMLGYPLMFVIVAAVWGMYPVLSLTLVKDKQGEALQPSASAAVVPAPKLGSVYLLLVITVLLGSMTVAVGRMGLSMAMKGEGFSAGDLSLANAAGGFITVPLTLLVGWLSDRLGRKGFLLLGYLAAVGSTLLLVGAQNLWQFCLVSSLVLTARSVITSMSPAYASDLVSRRVMEKALPMLNSMNWISGVIGFAASGWVLENLGGLALYGGASLLSLAAGLLLLFLPSSSRINVVLPAEGLQTTGD